MLAVSPGLSGFCQCFNNGEEWECAQEGGVNWLLSVLSAEGNAYIEPPVFCLREIGGEL